MKQIETELQTLYNTKMEAEESVTKGLMDQRQWNAVLSKQTLKIRDLLVRSQKIVASDPKNPDAKALEIELLHHSNPKGAREKLQRALLLFPGNPNLLALQHDIDKLNKETR
ncbi:MAG: hypothetical protein QM758_10825 [Armatimonas sp.]